MNAKQKPIITASLTFEWLIANSTGKNVTAAVIDSGVDAKHPDLQGKVSRACIVKQRDDAVIVCDEIPGADSFDSYGHGTAVAGIITNLAPDAEIVNIKILKNTTPVRATFWSRDSAGRLTTTSGLST